MTPVAGVAGLLPALCRVVLCAVFLLAAAGKLADRRGGRRAMAEFGVPEAWALALATALPWVELVVGLALLATATGWWAAIGALALLCAFALAIAANMARGRHPDCHCFGQLHSAPAGAATLGRNLLLAAMAAFLVAQGEPLPGLLAWLPEWSAGTQLAVLGGLLLLTLMAGQLALLVQVLRQQGRILLRLEALEGAPGRPAAGTAPGVEPPPQGLPVGSPAPDFRLDSLAGGEVALAELLREGLPLLLLFTHPGCGPCQALLPEAAGWQAEHRRRLTLTLVSEGSAQENRGKGGAHGFDHLLLQRKREVADRYHAWGTPCAVLVRPDGAIGSPVAQGAEAIRALVARTATSVAASPAAHPSLGQSAPPLELPDADGTPVALARFQGRDLLLLFWNPACGFCQRMLESLRAWDAAPPPGAPELVVVSSGSAEDARAMGLRAPVLLDPSQQAGAAFAAHGTPMAVRIDAQGRIASAVAAGADAVLALASAPSTRNRTAGARAG